ncbi:MAG: hypothetical protein ACK5OW_01525 [bacterium]
MKPKFNVGDKLEANQFEREQYGIEYVTITSINEVGQVYYCEADWNNNKIYLGHFFDEAKIYEDGYDVYCPICTGCGEEGCCSPLMCKQSQDGHYCESYLRDLKFGYKMYNDIYDLIPKDEETKKKLDEIFDKNYERYYTTK